MKKLLVIIILSLCFITSSQADDIRDFKIEGISVGDSLLDHYSENEIKNANTVYYPKSRKFYQIAFLTTTSETYDAININLKKGDNKYIVYSIKGLKDYDNKYKECLQENEKIVDEILSIVKNTKETSYKSDYVNEFGNSYATGSKFEVYDGTFTAYCAKWDKENEKVISMKWIDTLNVIIALSEWMDWLNTEAYK